MVAAGRIVELFLAALVACEPTQRFSVSAAAATRLATGRAPRPPVDGDALRAPDGLAVLVGNASLNGDTGGGGLCRQSVRRVLGPASAMAERSFSARCSTSTDGVAT